MCWAHCFRLIISSSIFIMIVLLASPLFAQSITISGSAGVGLFVAADKDYYGGIQTDLYPEIGGQIGISLIRIGLKAAYIYRKAEMMVWVYDPYFDDYYYDYYEYTLAYLPVQGELLIAPLDAMYDMPIISPYIGVMIGSFIPTGDNDDGLFALSLKAGSDINVEPLFLYGDIRYTWANHDYGYDTINAGGFMIVGGMGLRLKL